MLPYPTSQPPHLPDAEAVAEGASAKEQDQCASDRGAIHGTSEPRHGTQSGGAHAASVGMHHPVS